MSTAPYTVRLRALARELLDVVRGERDCLVESCTDALGDFGDDDDAREVVEELEALIARAEAMLDQPDETLALLAWYVNRHADDARYWPEARRAAEIVGTP